jgi:hypothetical protein
MIGNGHLTVTLGRFDGEQTGTEQITVTIFQIVCPDAPCGHGDLPLSI